MFYFRKSKKTEMKRIVYLTIILTLNFAVITCYSQYRAIRISNAKSLYWQIEIYSGINRSLIQKSSGSAYAIEGLKAMLKQQILENQLYANGGISIEGNRIIKAVLNKNDKFGSFDYLSIGIPLSAELSSLHNPRMSLYASLGCIPMLAIFNNIEENGVSKDNELSLLITPRIEGGIYINYKTYKLQLGAFAQRYMDISKESRFSNVGRTFGGLSFGLVF